MINSTLAPVILVGQTLIAKVAMTVLFRVKTTDKSTSSEDVKMILGSQLYKRVHAAQLNEAEYSGLFTAGLLFLSVKGVAAPWLSTLAVFGQVWYYWMRALVGNSHEGGIQPPPYAPGALARYAALGMLAFELYKLA